MPRNAKLAFLAIYTLILFALAPIKPLWLDEIIQLTGTSGTTTSEVIQHAAQNAGGAPLGYLTQHWLISITGSSLLSTRLISILCAILSLAVLLGIAEKLPISGPALTAALWIACPLAFRYALEGRPYMQGVLFALLAVATQIKLNESGRMLWAAAMTVSLIAAVYSQPFAVFAPLGFSLWTLAPGSRRYVTLAAYAVAAAAFLPWLVAVKSGWNTSIAHAEGGFQFGWPLAGVVIRELVGDGYLASIPALTLAAARAKHRPALTAAVLSASVLAIIGDAAFNYFFAVRQIIYLIPFLILLMSDGAYSLKGRLQPAAILLLALFFGGSFAKDYKYLTDSREDWPRFTAAILQAADNGCVLLPVADERKLYEYVNPFLKEHLCQGEQSAKIVMPSTQYTSAPAERESTDRLEKLGFKQTGAEQVGFGKLKVFVR